MPINRHEKMGPGYLFLKGVEGEGVGGDMEGGGRLYLSLASRIQG